ncbi:hypothetical protein GPECTOR_45g138 [Gonium pectorale]|uniref:U-box domain-containing protein n=1 Tax=Gonium pectorale TaxID=33097 RepID=A0A150G8W5_GONPE|nr:hypothetical protein GPECTOR_45g138 [Gonium pectorale]|eukprot:KXZ46268.1 hypothetical protein GPECTOR_45g138 [Gonium pectorale]
MTICLATAERLQRPSLLKFISASDHVAELKNVTARLSHDLNAFQAALSIEQHSDLKHRISGLSSDLMNVKLDMMRNFETYAAQMREDIERENLRIQQRGSALDPAEEERRLEAAILRGLEKAGLAGPDARLSKQEVRALQQQMEEMRCAKRYQDEQYLAQIMAVLSSREERREEGPSSQDQCAADPAAASAPPPATFGVPADFVCPLSLCVMRDPVMVESGHSFERGYIEKHLAISNSNPATNLKLDSRRLVPNIALRNAIQSWLDRHDMTYEQADELPTVHAAPAPRRSARRPTASGTASGMTVKGVDLPYGAHRDGTAAWGHPDDEGPGSGGSSKRILPSAGSHDYGGSDLGSGGSVPLYSVKQQAYGNAATSSSSSLRPGSSYGAASMAGSPYQHPGGNCGRDLASGLPLLSTLGSGTAHHDNAKVRPMTSFVRRPSSNTGSGYAVDGGHDGPPSCGAHAGGGRPYSSSGGGSGCVGGGVGDGKGGDCRRGFTSAAYTTFARVKSWSQVAGLDHEAKQHLQNAGVVPAIAQALVARKGPLTMADLCTGRINVSHVEKLDLALDDHMRLLEALQTARMQPQPPSGLGSASASATTIRQQGWGQGGSPGSTARIGGGGDCCSSSRPQSAVGSPPGGRGPSAALLPRQARLMDYVVISTEGSGGGTEASLSPARFGLVVMDVRAGERPLLVRTMQGNAAWHPRSAVTPADAASLPPGGMLVRRGYDWAPPPGVPSQELQRLRAEVGMLAETTTDGNTWRVFWAAGGESVLSTGRDGEFELQHLQVHPLSGAPVVDDDSSGVAMTPGSAVMRGLLWGELEGKAGTVGSLEPDERRGYVFVRWPRSRRAHYHASSEVGFGVNCCARPGEAVTVFNARQGLKVVRGRDWRWGSQDGDGGVGELVQPRDQDDNGVEWDIATYEAAGRGSLLPGTAVVLAPSVARDGPLRADTVGVVLAEKGGKYEVFVPRAPAEATGWYARPDLRPLPGKLAAERFPALLRLNRDGRAAFPGSGGGSGGDTDRHSSDVYYCGAAVNQCRCGLCEGGRCGPERGCPCHACAELIGLHVMPNGTLGR